MKIKKMLVLLVMFFKLLAMVLNGTESETYHITTSSRELSDAPNVSSTNIYKRSKEEEIKHFLRNKIPRAPILGSTSTIGQLTKQSDVIIAGKVKKLISKPIIEDSYKEIEYGVEVEVVNILYGHTKRKTFNVTYSKNPLESKTNIGDYLVLFLSANELSVDINALHFFYIKNVTSKSKNLLLLGHERGVVRLSSPYQEDELYKTIKNYIDVLRDENRDYKKYYEFLKKVTQVKIRRLLEDGNTDLILLLRTCDEINLNDVANDEELDTNFREYVRFVMIPDKEKKLKQEVEQ